MPKYYNEITKEIVDYPAEAAALFSVLKPVPSDRKTADDELEIEIEIEPDTKVVKPTASTKKDGTNAK